MFLRSSMIFHGIFGGIGGGGGEDRRERDVKYPMLNLLVLLRQYIKNNFILDFKFIESDRKNHCFE